MFEDVTKYIAKGYYFNRISHYGGIHNKTEEGNVKHFLMLKKEMPGLKYKLKPYQKNFIFKYKK